MVESNYSQVPQMLVAQSNEGGSALNYSNRRPETRYDEPPLNSEDVSYTLDFIPVQTAGIQVGHRVGLIGSKRM